MATTYLEEKTDSSLQALTYKDLQRAGKALTLPQRVDLHDNHEPLICEEILRYLPKKRLLALGRWGERNVAIKIFFDKKSAKRHAEADAFGIETLMQWNVPTAKLLYKGTVDKAKMYVHILERLPEGYNLQTIWATREKFAEIDHILKACVIELATQHVLGILQRDLHLNNFYVTDKAIYTLDGGQIDYFDCPLDKPISIDYLALFLVQLGVTVDALQWHLFDLYTNARGWLVKPVDIKAFHKAIEQHTKNRMRHFRKKIFRSCTQFHRIQKISKSIVYDRQFESPEFLKLLNHPDAFIESNQSVILKNGRSSTVAMVTLGDQVFAVKRYNNRNIFHWLSKTFRISRARKSWQISQQIYASGIATPKPIAFIESRVLGFLGKSYFITEYIEAPHMGQFFNQNKDDLKKCEFCVNAALDLLNDVAKLKITQGDLKMTNLLILNQEPYLIDFDGAREHISQFSLQRALKNEIERFIKNWEKKPEVYALFKKALGDHPVGEKFLPPA